MRCSQCGVESPFAGGRCAACGAVRPAPPAVAAGVLTPFPGALTPYPSEDGETMLGPVPTTGPVTRPAAPTTTSAPSSDTGQFAPGQAVGNRYHIIRLLGQGGMGCVYHAWDAELGVAVAMKVIRPEVTADGTVASEVERRFKRELLLARQVSHKNVVRIHDLGDLDGIKYITMSYIEGADLASVLRREGKLPVPRVVHLARQIAAGLQAAHEVGVVHRDLKPANVMVDANDVAQIMDFGIARSTVDSGVGTIAGTVVGTVEYMAPEQAQGLSVDARADIYAFGLILYDLLLGSRRRAGESVVSELMARMQSAPAPARSVDPAVPEALDTLITRCLQPDAARRFQATSEIVAALDALDDNGAELPEAAAARLPRLWSAAAAVAIALLVGSVTWFLTSLGSPGPAPAQEPVSVLVADFENRVNESVFDGTLENALTLAIEGASFVSTYSRRDAQALNAQVRPGKRLDEEGARLVSQREGVKIILAGILERDGSGYRVHVRAIDSVPGTVVAEATARAAERSEVLGAVNGVAADLRRALGDTASESGRELASETFTAASLEAAREYSIGQDLFQQNAYERAIEHYRRALQHDPEFGRAYSSWAIAAAHLGRTEESRTLFDQSLKRLDRMTEREKLRTLGVYYSRAAGNYEKAIENYTALLAKYPFDSIGINNLAVAYFNTLNFQEAREYGLKSVQVYPGSVLARYNHALYAMYAGDFAEARTHATKAIELQANTPKAYLALAMASAADGRLDEAFQTYERAAGTSARGRSLAAAGRADLLMYQGRFADAETVLADAIPADRESRNMSALAAKLVALAEAQSAQGRPAEGLRTLDEALAVSRSEAVAVPAAMHGLKADRPALALKVADEFAQQLVPRPRAYARLLRGVAALSAKRTPEAVQELREALKLADLWLVRYWLGVAYVQAGAYPEAFSELETCERRRGEATAVFLDDHPTWRYVVPVTYWLARAQEGMQMHAQAAANYKAYLSLRPASGHDPLAADARRRLGN